MSAEARQAADTRQIVTLMVAGQLCGIDVLKVRDVLGPQSFTPVPLAGAEVAGLLNLRGRIVTAIDLRVRLGLPPLPAPDDAGMNIVIDHDGGLYCLLVESVGEVLRLPAENFERTPATLDPLWRKYSEGVCRLEQGLLVVLNGDALFDYGKVAAA